MTLDEFNRLDPQSKKVLLFEANKIAERDDERCRYELFAVSDFFIETTTSRLYTFKRTIATYTVNDVPLQYAENVHRMSA